jgi:hypothetical protein
MYKRQRAIKPFWQQPLLTVKSTVQKSIQHSEQGRVSQGLGYGIFRGEKLSPRDRVHLRAPKKAALRVPIFVTFFILLVPKDHRHGPCPPVLLSSLVTLTLQELATSVGP